MLYWHVGLFAVFRKWLIICIGGMFLKSAVLIIRL